MCQSDAHTKEGEKIKRILLSTGILDSKAFIFFFKNRSPFSAKMATFLPKLKYSENLDGP